MSWQTYVDTNLIGTKLVSDAGIFGHDGNPWAVSANCKATAEDVKALLVALAGSDVSALYINGFRIGEAKYKLLRVDPDRGILYGKLDGENGLCIMKTAQACILGMYGPSLQAGNCNNVVEKLGDYLKSVGF